jgi:hypothetical protein
MAQPGNGGGPQPDKTVQDIKDLTSNTAALLKDAGFQNAAAIKVIGEAIALVAGAASLGTVGVIVAMIGIAGDLVSLFSSSSDQIAQVLQALEKIRQAEAEEADNLRRQLIQVSLSYATTVAQSLNALGSSPQPPPFITYQMQQILNSMNQVAPMDVSNRGCKGLPVVSGGGWTVPSNYQVYWTDTDSPDPGPFLGYGEQAPSSSGEDAFNYTYVLPAYLYAVSTFASVGPLIDPNFQQHWADNVTSAACLLQSVHDYIHTRITQLSPGPLSFQNLCKWWGGTLPITKGVEKRLANFGAGLTAVLRIEYGAVDKFSGVSSVGFYSLQPTFSTQEFGIPVTTFDPNENYDGAFQIRLQRRVKDVYVGTGLKHLQDAIDSLNKLVGQPISTGPSPGDWSLVRDIAGPAQVTRSDGTLHLSDVMGYLKRTAPADVPQVATINSLAKILSL